MGQSIETLAVALIGWSLMLEVEGRWPWQTRAAGEPPRAVGAGFETDAGAPLTSRRG